MSATTFHASPAGVAFATVAVFGFYYWKDHLKLLIWRCRWSKDLDRELRAVKARLIASRCAALTQLRLQSTDYRVKLITSTFASERPQVRAWVAKLVPCPGRHLTSSRPCICSFSRYFCVAYTVRNRALQPVNITVVCEYSNLERSARGRVTDVKARKSFAPSLAPITDHVTFQVATRRNTCLEFPLAPSRPTNFLERCRNRSIRPIGSWLTITTTRDVSSAFLIWRWAGRFIPESSYGFENRITLLEWECLSGNSLRLMKARRWIFMALPQTFASFFEP